MRKTKSLLTKLLIIYFIFTLIPISVISYFSSTQNYKMVWKNTTYSTKQLSDQILMSVSSVIEDSEYFTRVANEKAVRSYLMDPAGAQDYENAKAILSIFEDYLNNASFSGKINNIYLIGTAGKSICDRYGVGRVGAQDLEKISQTGILNMSSGKLVTTGNMNPHPAYADRQFVYIGMPLVVPPLLEPFGAVIIELKNEVIESLCSSVKLSESGAFSVIDSEEKVLFGDTQLRRDDIDTILRAMRDKGSGDFIETIAGQDTLIVCNPVPQTNWLLVGHVAMSDLMSDAYQFRQSLISSLIVVMLCSIALYIYFSNQLVLPLRRLKATMKMAAMGDKDVRYAVNTHDEIGDVGESFNSMIVELDRMARQDTKRQTAYQKTELDLLQAQINPHFLYNTLDTILWQARVGNNEAVVNTVDALGSFFRTTLSKGSGWIRVREEIEMIRNYLIIQKMRYGDVLRYEIDVEPELEGGLILKLTLQPIVENAIYHGLKSRDEGGMLRICGRAAGEYMVFTIEDDGMGMSPQELEELRQKLDRYPTSIYERSDGGFGLRNVNGRIRLYYGPDCGVSIESTQGVGTKVTVRLRREANYA